MSILPFYNPSIELRNYHQGVSQGIIKDNQLISGFGQTQDQYNFSGSESHQVLLANNSALRQLFGNDQHWNSADVSNSFKIFQNFNRDNILKFLVSSSANDVKTTIARLQEYFVAGQFSQNTNSVITNNLSTGRTYTGAIASISPLASQIASLETGDPYMEGFLAFVNTVRTLLLDDKLTGKGGVLEHMVKGQSGLFQELEVVQKRLERYQSVREANVTMGQNLNQVVSEIAQPPQGGGNRGQ